MQESKTAYNPLVSVIIPCYNGGRYLAETLDNISEQSYTNWECIIVDDGSTDNSKEVAAQYVKKDHRFRYLTQQNGGPSVARNYGIELSKGEFIQFVDGDDMIEKNKLQKQIEIFETKKDCDIVYGNSAYFYSAIDGNPQKQKADPQWQKKISGKGDSIISNLLQGNIMVIHSPLIRKTVFNKVGMFDPEIWFNEDWDVWVRCAINNLIFVYDDTPGTKALIRVHENNRSKDLFEMYLNGLKVCLKISKLLSSPGYLKVLKYRIIVHLNFLEKNIVKSYISKKDEALKKAKRLYSVTNLKRHNVFLKLLNGSPRIIIILYQKRMRIINYLNMLMYAP